MVELNFQNEFVCNFEKTYGCFVAFSIYRSNLAINILLKVC